MASTIRPTFYVLNESEVLNPSTKLPNGAFICCKDSTNIYVTSVTGSATPIKMVDNIIYLTESERELIIAPINRKHYFCIDTGKLWVYYSGWICVNPDQNLEFDFEDVVLPSTGSIVVTDSRIVAGMTGTFYPDSSVEDLVSDINVTIANGQATITGSTEYSIPGILKIKK